MDRNIDLENVEAIVAERTLYNIQLYTKCGWKVLFCCQIATADVLVSVLEKVWINLFGRHLPAFV